MAYLFNYDILQLLISPDYSILDNIPITSLIKGYVSFTLSIYPGISFANEHIMKGILIQVINFVLYLVIFILTEKDFIGKALNYLKVKLFIITILCCIF